MRMLTHAKQTHRYLTSSTSPLSKQNATYSPPAFRDLLQRLARYNLTKTEALMIFNLRPKGVFGFPYLPYPSAPLLFLLSANTENGGKALGDEG